MSDKPPMDPKGKGKFKHATSSNRTSNNWTPDELEKNWETAWNDPKRTSVTSKYDGLQIEFGAMVSNSMKDDKNLFLDNRRGSIGAKYDITDEHSLDIREAPLVKKLINHPKSNVTSQNFDGRAMLSPPWAVGLKGYLKDGVRNLGFKLDDNRIPVLSKVKGSEFAQKTHEDVINYYLRQAIAKDEIIEEFLDSEETSFGIRWEHDTTPQNAHKKLVKQLAKAQVFWLEPFVANLIDAGADALYEEGLRTGVWPVVTADEMSEFDMNMFVVSVGSDEFSGATWPTIHWFHTGRSYRSPSLETYKTGNDEEIVDAVNGIKNGEDFANNPLARTPHTSLLAIGFNDWGVMDAQTSWNFDETMKVILGKEDTPIEEYEWLVEKREVIRKAWLKEIRASGVEYPIPPFETNLMPSWATSPDNARVRCGIRALLDYINRKNREELPEIAIPYRRLKLKKRDAGKHGFDPKGWKPTIKIIDLPRKPYKPSSNPKTHRKLTCQHLVEQHIRQQHFPTLGPAYLDEEKEEWNPQSHRPILIPTYIKGPEDKPFKEYNAVVYAVLAGEEEKTHA